MRDVRVSGPSGAASTNPKGGLRRRIGFIAGLALVAGFALPAAGAQAAAPVVVNTGTGCAPWLVSCTTGGETVNAANITRFSVLVAHDSGVTIPSLVTDDDYDANDFNASTVRAATSTTKPNIFSGYPRSRVNLTYTSPTSNSGISKSTFLGACSGRTARSSDRNTRIKARDSGNVNSAASASSNIRFVGSDSCSGFEDYAYLYSWGANNFNQIATPGAAISWTYKGDDNDSSGDSDFNGISWRWRNLRTNATTAQTLSCPGNGDNVDKTIATTVPNSRGAYVMEAELMDGSGCSSNQNPGYFFPIGTVDVNSAAAPTLNLNASRPQFNGNSTISATGLVDPDSANGGGAQIIQWDLDENTGNGVSGFETDTVAGEGSILSAPQTKTVNTTGMSPGLHTVRAQVTDNGAMDAADSIRKTSSVMSTTFLVDSAPVLTAPASVNAERGATTGMNLSATDPDGDTRTYSVQTGPSHGSGSFTSTTGASTTYNYTPTPAYTGTDSITFKVDDGFGRSDTKTVNITVADTTAPDTTIDSGPADGSTTNDNPVTYTFSSSEGSSTFECNLDGSGFTSCTSPASYSNLAAGSHTFAVRATDQYGNTDASPASTTFTVTDSGVASGNATTTTYTAQPGDSNDVTVTGGNGQPYVITDNGGGNVDAGANCTQLTPSSVSCPDTANVIVNLGDDNDTFSAAGAGGGNFTINGGDGSDRITGGPGNDTLNGGNGDASTDRLEGGPGNDTIDGGPGVDRSLYLNSTGDVTATIDNVANDSDGAGGTDNVLDTIESITGGSGNDTITGSCLANTIAGQGGNDAINGDPSGCVVGGNDFMGGGTGDDGMSGLDGSDSVTYTTNTAAQPISVTLDGVANDNDGQGGTDNIGDDVENVYGGSGDDTIDATDANQGVALWGRPGNDTLIGSTFNDYLRGENGADNLNCAAGANDMFDVDPADTVDPSCETPG